MAQRPATLGERHGYNQNGHKSDTISIVKGYYAKMVRALNDHNAYYQGTEREVADMWEWVFQRQCMVDFMDGRQLHAYCTRGREPIDIPTALVEMTQIINQHCKQPRIAVALAVNVMNHYVVRLDARR